MTVIPSKALENFILFTKKILQKGNENGRKKVDAAKHKRMTFILSPF